MEKKFQIKFKLSSYESDSTKLLRVECLGQVDYLYLSQFSERET